MNLEDSETNVISTQMDAMARSIVMLSILEISTPSVELRLTKVIGAGRPAVHAPGYGRSQDHSR